MALAAAREAEQLCRDLGYLHGLQACLGNQANVLNDQGDPEGAMALYQEQGQYGKAEPLILRTLAIWEKQLGPEHPHTATFRENYAVLLRIMQHKEKEQHKSP